MVPIFDATGFLVMIAVFLLGAFARTIASKMAEWVLARAAEQGDKWATRVTRHAWIRAIRNETYLSDATLLTLIPIVLCMALLLVLLDKTERAAGTRSDAITGISILKLQAETTEGWEGKLTPAQRELLDRLKIDYEGKETKSLPEHIEEMESGLSQASFNLTVWLALLVTAFIFYCYIVWGWGFRRFMAAKLACYHSRYMDRMMAIASAEDKQKLASLESRVKDETSLKEFLAELGTLGGRYSFPYHPVHASIADAV